MGLSYSITQRQFVPGIASFSAQMPDVMDHWRTPDIDQAEVQRMLLHLNSDKARFYVLPAVRASDSTISGARYAVQNQSSLETTSPMDTVAYESYKATAMRKISKLSARWHKSLLDVASDSSSKALAYTTKLIFESIIKFGPTSVDLTGLEAEKVNPMHLAVILRVTKNRKSLVPGWDEALKVAVAALQLHKLNEDVVLVGIK